MSYFQTAEEAARHLGLELLGRAEPDARALVRHTRLAACAAGPVPSGSAWSRISAHVGGSSQEKVFWFSAPYGGMEQLPWAVGIAELLARGGGEVLLGGPEIGSLLPPQGSARTFALPKAARERLGDRIGPNDLAISTDLEGVRLVVPRSGTMSAPEESVGGDWTFLWVESLPEELGAALPREDTFDGVIFVASFRDHSPFELDACTRQLQGAGHPLLGLIAIGPEDGAPVAPSREEARPSAPAPTPSSAQAGRAKPGSIWEDSRARSDAKIRAAVPPPTRPPLIRDDGEDPQERHEVVDPEREVTQTSWAHLSVKSPDSPFQKGDSAPPSNGSSGKAPDREPPADATNRGVEAEDAAKQKKSRKDKKRKKRKKSKGGAAPLTAAPATPSALDAGRDDTADPAAGTPVGGDVVRDVEPLETKAAEPEAVEPQPADPRAAAPEAVEPEVVEPEPRPTPVPDPAPEENRSLSRLEFADDSDWDESGWDEEEDEDEYEDEHEDEDEDEDEYPSGDDHDDESEDEFTEEEEEPEEAVSASDQSWRVPQDEGSDWKSRVATPAPEADPEEHGGEYGIGDLLADREPEPEPEREPEPVSPAAAAEGRAIPLMSMWEQEQHKKKSSRAVVQALSVTIALLALSTLFWFATGRTVGDFKELVGLGEEAAESPVSPAEGTETPAGDAGEAPAEAEPADDAGAGTEGSSSNVGQEDDPDVLDRGGAMDVELLAQNVERAASLEDDRVLEDSRFVSQPLNPVERGTGSIEPAEKPPSGMTGSELAASDSDAPAPNAPDPNVPDTNVPDASVPDANAADSNVPDSTYPDSKPSEAPATELSDSGLPSPVLSTSDSKASDLTGTADLSSLDGTESIEGAAPVAEVVSDEIEPGRGYVIQLSSFQTPERAAKEADRLRDRILDVHTVEVSIPNRGTWFRVVTGQFATSEEARAYALGVMAELGIRQAYVAGRGGLGNPLPIALPDTNSDAR